VVTWLAKLTLSKIAPWLALALLTALGASHWWAYSAGVSREQDRAAAALMAQEQRARQRQEVLADELEQAQKERTVVTREIVRYVDRAPDPTGVLDAPVLDDRMFSALGGNPDDARQ
jgi:hypothetical protein